MSESEARAFEARAETRILHQHRGPPRREPSARRQADRNILTWSGDVRQAGMSLERRDQVFDQRAGYPAEKVEPAALQGRSELVTEHGRQV